MRRAQIKLRTDRIDRESQKQDCSKKSITDHAEKIGNPNFFQNGEKWTAVLTDCDGVGDEISR